MQEEKTGVEKHLYSSSVTGSVEIHPKTSVLYSGTVCTVVASDLWMTTKRGTKTHGVNDR